jgi:hypothetical protein
VEDNVMCLLKRRVGKLNEEQSRCPETEEGDHRIQDKERMQLTRERSLSGARCAVKCEEVGVEEGGKG